LLLCQSLSASGVEAHDHDEIRLRPLYDEPRLVNKGGVLVVQAKAVGSLKA
jgi:hypothetical protein